MRQALIIAGPTCSGKSALALGLAERLGGTVINADSMQVYRELRIVTARPSLEDEARAPHLLYGVRPAAAPGSVGWWRGAALAEMEHAAASGRLPILCGGTGLYLQALTRGLAEIPDPGPDARAESRALLEAEGPQALHARLVREDPATAALLRPSDSQRLARAWEIWRGTGKGLSVWQAQAGDPAPFRFRVLQLDPDRTELRQAIAARFATMVRDGAVEEVRGLLALGLDPSLPAMRAQGVPELASYLAGELSLAEATHRAVLATGQYVKRQSTWFRRRALAAPGETYRIGARVRSFEQFSESGHAQIINFIVGSG